MSELDKTFDHFFISSQGFEPAYMALYRSGELQERSQKAIASLKKCRVCPRNCDVNRLADEKAICNSGRYPLVSSHFPHVGEEDCLRGKRGSGTIFFANCNLRCVFCQNFDISQEGKGKVTNTDRLAEMMLELQWLGCHNINYVTPEHVVPQILEALVLAVEAGLNIPIVYNTSAYDSMESLGFLDGIVDIYMPDFKVWDVETSLRYLKAKDYPQVARKSLIEMQRQVGELKVDEQGIAKRGVLLRHLVMPDNLAKTEQIMQFIAEKVSPNTYVNLMGQYHPAGKVSRDKYGEINRRVTLAEIQSAYDVAREAGIWRFDKH